MTYFSPSLSKLSPALPIAAVLVATLAVAPTMAQQNSDVSVNLEALGLSPTLDAGSEPRLILKYPGSSTATRQVPQLRYPSVPAPTARPKPPAPATTVKAAPAEAPAPKAAMQAVKPAAQPATQPAAQPAVEAAATPPAKPETRATATAAATPAPQPVEATPPKSITPAAEPAPAPVTAPAVEEPQVAALSPPAPVTALPDPDPAILRVLFDEDTAAIIGSARSDLDAIGESLRYDPRRIELKAYGGEPGNKASEARRISLKRGLAVRAYLIGLGIDSRRIDVRALGGVTDTGSADRVDVAYSGS
ncbi:OmpA family protein [Pyruvatibacter sp.]|uniref:OmpA family protein n=1 Tax=Pyruvatibacter sp. TaxID=1981328 RepID=UPI0032679386